MEAELNKLNVSKSPSNQEFSTYLMSMNQLIQNLAANEENDKNLKNHFDAAVKHFNEYKVEMKIVILNQLTELEHYKQKSESESSKVMN